MMGSARLKKKDEFKYRKGGSGTPNCGRCAHVVRDFQTHTMNGAPLNIEPRCRIMGLENGRRYRVRLDHVCDRIEDTFRPPEPFRNSDPKDAA